MTACLRCLQPNPPEPGSLPTCETAGIWPPAAQGIAGIGLTSALRLLIVGSFEAVLTELDLEQSRMRQLRVERKSDCPACGKRELAFLSGKLGWQATRLCGRDMVHLSPPQATQLDLPAMARRLGGIFRVQETEYLLHLKSAEAEIYLFPDGRAFVKGISDPARARAIFNRYVGA